MNARTSTASLVLGALACLTNVAGAQTCTGGTELISQPVDYMNGFKSDATPNSQVVAEQMVLAQAMTLDSIAIMGTFANSNASNNFTLIVHEDSGGLPGAALYSEQGIAATVTPTGLVLPPPLVPTDEVEVLLTPAAAVTLPAGVVWFEIYNDAAGGDAFFWLTGTLDASNGIAAGAIGFAAPVVDFFNLGLDLAMSVCGSPAGSVGTNYCLSTANSTGLPSTISATGSTSISANDLVLTADNLPAQPGIFIAGPLQAQIPLFNGFLCVDPAGLQRFINVSSPAGGTITEAVDYGASAAGGLNVSAGSSYFYQRWNRDPAAGNGNANFSDGLEIVHTP